MGLLNDDAARAGGLRRPRPRAGVVRLVVLLHTAMTIDNLR